MREGAVDSQRGGEGVIELYKDPDFGTIMSDHQCNFEFWYKTGNETQKKYTSKLTQLAKIYVVP